MRRVLRVDKLSVKVMCKEIGVDYGGFIKWMGDEDRGIRDGTLDKIAEYMGKKIVLIDDEE